MYHKLEDLDLKQLNLVRCSWWMVIVGTANISTAVTQLELFCDFVSAKILLCTSLLFTFFSDELLSLAMCWLPVAQVAVVYIMLMSLWLICCSCCSGSMYLAASQNGWWWFSDCSCWWVAAVFNVNVFLMMCCIFADRHVIYALAFSKEVLKCCLLTLWYMSIQFYVVCWPPDWPINPVSLCCCLVFAESCILVAIAACCWIVM